jgi:2-desacetyl-2-hydroxyethyl bacteriochlorophyllide A dehydrogenase
MPSPRNGPAPVPETRTGLRAVVPSERTVAFERFELPGVLSRSQVLIRMERTVISAGTETANYTGLDAGTRQPGNWNTYPWRPGYGGVGRIIEAGPQTAGYAIGDRVYGIFHHASHEVVDTASELCVPVPGGLDAATAVMARMGNVAITARQRSRAAPGESVLVFGLGAVGNLAGQFFVAAGCQVYGADPAASRRALAERCGFRATVDPAGLEEDEPLRRLGFSGDRPGVVIDAVGDSRVVIQASELVRRNGEVILLGTPRAPHPGDLTPLLNRVHARGLHVIGALEWNIPLLGDEGLSTERNAREILGMVSAGTLQVAPLISHVLRPEALQEAYEGLLAERDRYLGVVLDWDV